MILNMLNPPSPAREALRSKHPLMKLRPLSKSSSATKAKARSCSGNNTAVCFASSLSVCCLYLTRFKTKIICLSCYSPFLPLPRLPPTSQRETSDKCSTGTQACDWCPWCKEQLDKRAAWSGEEETAGGKRCIFHRVVVFYVYFFLWRWTVFFWNPSVQLVAKMFT